MTESRLLQAFDVGVPGFRQQYVFQCLSFTCYFEVAVALCSFEIVVHVNHQTVHAGGLQLDLFRENQNIPRGHCPTQRFQQRQPLVNGNKLQRVIEYADAGIAVTQPGDVPVLQCDVASGQFAIQGCPAPGKHGL